jgi:predicted nucleic acid-binding protein
MTNLFADTSGWGNLIDSSQVHHKMAVALYRQARQQKRKVVTTNYIITELVALLTSPLHISRTTIISFIQGLKTSLYLEVVHINISLDTAAWQLIANREDKEWRLVDCSSFVVMQRYGLREALTADHHFEQAGFIRLLKS